MKLKIAFRVIQGHQITDEELYKTEGHIPVLTGKNQIKGYWNKSIIKKEELPCITYPTKANSGEAYIQHKIFDANNTAILIPFKEPRKKISLEWLVFKLPPIFLKVQTSKEGVSYLNKEIVEDIELEIPDETIQKKELAHFIKLKNIKDKLLKIADKINSILDKNLIIEDINRIEISLSDILEHVSRNDCLSEEGLYKRSQDINKLEKKITVISGSIKGFYGYVPFDDTLHVVKKKPCLQVITRGKAGQLRFLPNGNYATNTNSMLLIIKDDKKNELGIENNGDEENYLRFLEVFLQPYFIEYCSSADLSVFPLTEAINKITIPLIKLDNRIIGTIKKYGEIKAKKQKIETTLNMINDSFSKQIVIT